MRNLAICERCDGSGADPQQTLFIDEIRACIDCFGDGCVAAQVEREYEPLRLSA